MKDGSPITHLEHGIFVKLSDARFPPATASKRFVLDYANGYIKQLSPRGRKFLAFITHRFRRQYVLEPDEWAWVMHWLVWEDSQLPNLGIVHDSMLPKPLSILLDSLPRAKPPSL